MKVQEIRDELLARDLSDKGKKKTFKYLKSLLPLTVCFCLLIPSIGVRNIVVARLAKALSTEKAEEKKAKNRERLMKKKQKRNAVKTSDDKDDPSSAKGNKSSEKLDDSKDDWADAIDFELSDIVILDEYDASKNPEVIDKMYK